MTGQLMRATAMACVLGMPLGTAAAHAEMQLSFYLGAQSSPHSTVNYSEPGASFSFRAGWEGRSAETPPYYGVRATWWRSENVGFGVELNHAKVYLEDDIRAANNFDRFELTDGINIVTVNAFYRWPGRWASGRLTPYVGGGAGLSIPHVDVQRDGGPKTFEYQVTGPAVAWMAGFNYDINDTWGVFAEYKGTYSMNEADLTGGGSFSTDITTNALNLGVSYNF